MKLSSLIPDSAFAIIATVEGEESLEKAKVFLGANEEVLRQFPIIILHVNYSREGARFPLVKEYCNLYISAFLKSKVITIAHFPNPGHMFGTIDLDEACLQSVKGKGMKYIWKANDDMLIGPALLDKQVLPKDLYYLPGFSYETLLNAGCTANLMRDYEEKWFAPQSTFFILDTTKVGSLYGDITGRKKVWEEAKTLSGNPKLKPWEVPQPDGVKFGLEDLLGHTTKNLAKQSLLSQESFHKLIDHVKYHAEGDPSHKSVMIKEIGVCHYHNWKGGKVYEV